MLHGHLKVLKLKFGRHPVRLMTHGGKISDAVDIICDRLLSPPFDELENGEELMKLFQEYCCDVAELKTA